ncbi:MAG: hypothetical protein ACJAXZ_002079, partial [Akkermansiaceae bacterium]
MPAPSRSTTIANNSGGLPIPAKSPPQQRLRQHRKHRLPSPVALPSPATSLRGGGDFRLRYLYGTHRISNWPSRDPIGDWAFFSTYTENIQLNLLKLITGETLKNLYSFINNSPANSVDKAGLFEFPEIKFPDSKFKAINCKCGAKNASPRAGLCAKGGDLGKKRVMKSKGRCSSNILQHS